MLVHIADLFVEALDVASTAEYDEHHALQSQQCSWNAANAHRAANAVSNHIVNPSYWYLVMSLLCLPLLASC